MKVHDILNDDSFGVQTLRPKEIAKRHRVPLSLILAELKIGIETEKEHTTDEKIAREIALDHLKELPDYYSRLTNMEKAGRRI